MRVQKINFVSFSYLIKFACFLSIIGYVQCAGFQCRTKVTFISRGYEGQTYPIENLPKILENEHFDVQKVTAIYSYGFTQTINMPSVRNVLDAYLENGDFNFMIVHCDSILAYTLFTANRIANDIASSLIKMFEAGYDKFHLVGFSLGAQISGLVGRRVIRNSNGRFKIPRITGLDPGQIMPLFGLFIADLNINDAYFVDIIHGETKSFGSTKAVGHANFWPNGGNIQPMCQSRIDLLTSVCSHLMTPKFWAESIKSKNPNVFRSQKCDSFDDFLNDRCDKTITSSMGLYADKETWGNFYLKTNLYPPYSKD